MQLDIFSYPHTPGFKEHTTSKMAAEAMKPKAPKLRERVLDWLRLRSSGTPDQCAAETGINLVTVRARFTELKMMGKIREVGIGKSACGKPAKIYAL